MFAFLCHSVSPVDRLFPVTLILGMTLSVPSSRQVSLISHRANTHWTINRIQIKWHILGRLVLNISGRPVLLGSYGIELNCRRDCPIHIPDRRLDQIGTPGWAGVIFPKFSQLYLTGSEDGLSQNPRPGYL